jgi:hypothetical protein
LIHQLPPKPDYFRVKIWRRLQRIGAVSIKNSVYVLPHTEQAVEDFQWLVAEIIAGGGEASVCDAAFVEGLSDGQVESLFRASREAEYAEIAEEAEELLREPPATKDPRRRSELASVHGRLGRRLGEVAARDFFGAPARQVAETALARLDGRTRPPDGKRRPTPRSKTQERNRVAGRLWVTRRGAHIDRIASAWLIRRFIDPKARFRFVDTQGYRPAPGEVRFDMYEAEYTHEGERCTFETLLYHFGLRDPALRALGEMVHDVDLKEMKFARPETAGLERLIDGIVRTHPRDEDRLAQGAVVLNGLFEALEGELRG